MARASYPSDGVDRLMLRMPAGLRDSLRAAADANNRSMNAEIVDRLELSVAPPMELQFRINNELGDNANLLFEALTKQSTEAIARLQKRIAELEAERSRGADLRITLDSRGYPISWEEIRTHASAAMKLLPQKVMSVEMRIVADEVVSSSEREDDAEALRKWYRSNQRLQGEEPAKTKKPAKNVAKSQIEKPAELPTREYTEAEAKAIVEAALRVMDKGRQAKTEK